MSQPETPAATSPVHEGDPLADEMRITFDVDELGEFFARFGEIDVDEIYRAVWRSD